MTQDPMQETTPASVEASQDTRNLALLIWLGTLFFSFIPGLVVYLLKQDNAYLRDQAKEALNWSITVMLGYGAAFALSLVVIGLLAFPIIAICNLVVCIMGVVATSSGKNFTTPFCLRLIK